VWNRVICCGRSAAALGSEGLWGDGRRRGSLVTPHRAPGGSVLEVESNIPTNGGNSGGAIVNDHGEVVAVHRAARTDCHQRVHSH